ncbi:MAG: 2-C-methyl-D-erythritol 2,4-cyclodiphosphate synthase [Actinomycetota bacterium]|nr:2-C-methyl-D-erythritol 2,4-cyclodiphosphate synthase [Actinomycetota bacterium]
MRIGLGFDAHARDGTRRLVLGGVVVPDVPGLAGHSDADVLCHSIADALLGAAALGDLGSRFPDTDEWRDASSLTILSEAAQLLGRAAWDVVNVDATLIAEAPRLAPYRDAMVNNIAAAIGIETGQVSVKATTTDTMGFTGRGEGMAAIAVASIERTKVP